MLSVPRFSAIVRAMPASSRSESGSSFSRSRARPAARLGASRHPQESQAHFICFVDASEEELIDLLQRAMAMAAGRTVIGIDVGGLGSSMGPGLGR